MSREFVLTDGKNYIHSDVNGRYKKTSNATLADVFETQELATKIRDNSVPKVLSLNLYVAEIKNGEIVQCNTPKQPKAVQKRSQKSFAFDSGFKSMKWCKNFIGMENLFSDAAKRMDELSQELSDTDAMIIDIEHYIEFTSLNARDGFKIYRRLKKLLQKRRDLKNEQKIVSAINRNHAASEQIKQILNVINDESDLSYRPRILVDLFECGKIDGEIEYESNIS